MLTTNSNQYLRPDYLTPLPTTLDAKKSPLALLAQTCSQIGADSSSSSSGMTNKSCTSSSNNNNNESNSSLSIGKSKSTNSMTTNNKSHHHHHDRNSKTLPPPPKKCEESSSSNNSRSNSSSCGGGQDPMSTEGVVNVTTSSASEPDINNKNHGSKTPCSKGTTPNPSPSSSSSSSTSFTTTTTTNPTNKSPSTSITPVTSSSLAADSTLSSSKSSHNVPVTVPFPTVLSSATKLNHTTNPSNFTNNTNSSSSLDLIGLKHSGGNTFPFPGLYPSSNGTGSSANSTTLAPYLHSYARLKAASSSASNGSTDSLLPMALSSSCRDPFCTGCQLGQGHGFNTKGICPIGCLQCDHVKTPYSSPFGFIPGFPIPPSLANFYSNQANPLQPYVCNWVVGDSYCLKRFSSPDDLLIHLKTHTATSSNISNQEALQSLAAAAAAAGYPPSLPFPSHSMLFNPHSFLSRTYPTPPLSPLLSSSRFHPYSKGTSHSLSPGVNTVSNTSPFPSGFPPLSHPAFNPYYPYSLYSQRLGGGASSNGSLHP